jgi:hypothetical protein
MINVSQMLSTAIDIALDGGFFTGLFFFVGGIIVNSKYSVRGGKKGAAK